MTLPMHRKPRVLFVCTHNAARSQMAEGLLRALGGDRYEALSAGTHPGRVHPLAVEALAELGIDASGHTSKSVDAFRADPPEYVVTVCDHAREACPYLPARTGNLHHAFTDPSAPPGDANAQRAAFRRVRDEIRAWLEATFLADLPV